MFQDCDCNLRGSTSTQCHLETGQCFCYEEFSGMRCDQCRHGYYSYPSCRSCDCVEAGTVTEWAESDQMIDVCDDNGHCQCNDTGHCPCKVRIFKCFFKL